MMEKNKQTQTFLYCNYDSKKKTNLPQLSTVLMPTPKKQIDIAFLLLSIQLMTHNNSRALKKATRKKKLFTVLI